MVASSIVREYDMSGYGKIGSACAYAGTCSTFWMMMALLFARAFELLFSIYHWLYVEKRFTDETTSILQYVQN
jgi:hypothetical protein